MYFDNKGLASAELLFIMLIALVIFGSMISLVGSGMNSTSTAEMGQARMTGERIVEALNMVYINGDGYSIDLDLQSDLNFIADVNSTGSDSTVTVYYGGKTVPIKFIAKNLDANYTLTSGNSYVVKNVNGIISITN